MLDQDGLKQIVHDAKHNRTTKLLLCLAVGDTAKSVADIKAIAKRAGIAGAHGWNISSLLSASGKAIRTDAGWELTSGGKSFVAPLAGPLMAPPPPKAATALRAVIPSIASPDAKAFVEEAVVCFEHKLYRAAVVLSWVGAVAVLYDHVVANHLTAFNAEATKRTATSKNPWKPAKNADDLTLMKENDFLQVIQSISVIGKNVKGELEICLKLRNGCGHPNSLVVGESKVAAHLETLMQNVFAKF